ncbi:hypothetical protein R8O11_26900, partial [Vibrio sp. 1288]|nr:hypothetical protein [Vibrio sp. 1288]
MKKVLIAVLILLLLGGAGAGYYFFFMQKDEPEKPVAAKTEKAPVDKGDASKPIMDLEAPAPEITEYYVIERRVNVYNKPDDKSLIVDALYKGEKVS